MRVSVLAHNQPVEARASTYVSRTVADELVRRMICEKISNKRIRMFPPKSVFLAERPNRPASYSLPDKLPPAEVENCKFVPPTTAASNQFALGWDWNRETWPEDLLRLSPDPRSPQTVAVLPTQNSAYDSGELPL